MRDDLPTGLVGLHSRDPIAVHIAMGVKGPSGSPTYGGRWWIMSPQVHSEEFTSKKTGNTRRDLARSGAAGFEKWNAAAKALGERVPLKGPGRVGILRGALVHADLEKVASWRRGAYRLPEGHPNPKSRKHACVGNGITALRYSGMTNGEEQFSAIACPNRECQFAINGACKVDLQLLFNLRWDKNDPWEKDFPEVLAHFDSHGWETVERLRGLFEYVLGTEALLTEAERELTPAAEREKWTIGLAQEFGIQKVSLVGLPFTLTISEKTRKGDESSPHGKRNSIVNFSWDGLLIPWLLNQREQRAMLSEGELPKMLPPIAVNDPVFQDGPMIDAVAEGFPGSGDHPPFIDVEPSGSLPEEEVLTSEAVIEGLQEPVMLPGLTHDAPQVIDIQAELKLPPARLSSAAKERIRNAMPKEMDTVDLERLAGGNLDMLPATLETTILSDLQRWKGVKRP